VLEDKLKNANNKLAHAEAQRAAAFKERDGYKADIGLFDDFARRGFRFFAMVALNPAG